MSKPSDHPQPGTYFLINRWGCAIARLATITHTVEQTVHFSDGSTIGVRAWFQLVDQKQIVRYA